MIELNIKYGDGSLEAIQRIAKTITDKRSIALLDRARYLSNMALVIRMWDNRRQAENREAKWDRVFDLADEYTTTTCNVYRRERIDEFKVDLKAFRYAQMMFGGNGMDEHFIRPVMRKRYDRFRYMVIVQRNNYDREWNGCREELLLVGDGVFACMATPWEQQMVNERVKHPRQWFDNTGADDDGSKDVNETKWYSEFDAKVKQLLAGE